MTQEEKDLLLKDLCARLPYGVKYMRSSWDYDTDQELPVIETLECVDQDGYINHRRVYTVDDIKPYLFPLSSMTEEQKQEYTYIVNYISSDDTENWKEGEFIYVEQFNQLMHFYHINHLDYMGLIPMGLAIDATGLNIY